MSIHLTNTGTTTTTINNKKTNEISWNANYDGKEADINVQLYNNGKQEEVFFKLSNEELKNLLNAPIIERPIDQRLMHDFRLKTRTPNKRNKSNKKIIKKINKKINKKITIKRKK